MKPRGKTPPFRGPHGKPLPGSIAEAGYLRLGGLEQWVMIRGERLANPPLILLHGGPGLTETRLFRHFNAPLEKDFTVVYWDQRGAGKSYARDIPRASMTVEQFIEDLDELVDTVRVRTGQQRVVLFGHSWGTVLGVLYAARFPEKVGVYVGSAQIGSWPESEAASYAFALAEARRRHNRRALNALEAMGPPPYSARSVFKERTWLSLFEGQFSARPMWKLLRAMVGQPESSILELPRLMRAFRYSLDAMWAEVSAVNLIERVPRLTMPVFFFLGRRDHWVPPETTLAYFNALTAPAKQLVWFDESSHEPFVDEPEKFNAAMRGLVRPMMVEILARDAHAGGALEEHAPTPG